MPPTRPTPDFLADAWTKLGGPHASGAYDAALALSQSEPSLVISFLRTRLRPTVAVPVSNETLDRLIREIDSVRFKERDQAMGQLTDLGIAAAPALRAALARHESLEADRRIAALLSRIDAENRKPEILQSLRALRVLEDFDDSDARLLVTDLAAGAPGSRLTIEAQATLSRMKRRLASRCVEVTP